MNRKTWTVITSALLAFLLTLLMPVLVQAQSYETVKTITGPKTTTADGGFNETTDYFNVPTGEWRITWSYVPTPSIGKLTHTSVFLVYAYPKGETVRYVAADSGLEGLTNTSGVIYVHERQGADYYLNIGGFDVQSYNVTIEKFTDISPSPSIPEYPVTVTVMVLIIALGIVGTVLLKKQALKSGLKVD